jgi:ribonuclease D
MIAASPRAPPSGHPGRGSEAAGYNARMVQPPPYPPTLIQEPDQLKSLLPALKHQPRLAVDTESNSLYAYRERVCLIQISIPGADFLIDPLALTDLSPLGPVFANPRIEKVFHAAEYDLLCMKRDFGFTVSNLFDTRVACRTLGCKQTGLGDLLQEAFGVSLDKRCQRANWGKRPLPPDLLDYARLDTYFLLPLRDRLERELQQAGRLEECEEATLHLARIALNHQDQPQGFWGMSHARQLPPTETAILRELYLMRDKHARRLDRPAFKVMEDKTLVEIARLQPANLPALADLPGMTSRQVERYGEELLAAVARGQNAPHPRRPRAERADQKALARYEILRQWRKLAAAERQVESDVILPREVLWEIARSAPRELKDLESLMMPLAWRFQSYGPAILHALWNQP